MTTPDRYFYGLRRMMLLVVVALGTGAGAGWLLGYVLLGVLASQSLVLAFLIWDFRNIEHRLNNSTVDPLGAPSVASANLDETYLLEQRSRQAQAVAEPALNYLQDSLASMRDAALIIDERGNITWSNASSVYLLGVRFPRDRGRSVISLIQFPEFLDYFEQQDYGYTITRTPTKAGERCLQFEVTRFGQGNRLLFVRDITKNFKLEKMRKDFVGNVSHELRTPLTVIKGYLETLIDMDSLLDARLEKPLRQMGEQVKRMETLLADLLWLSRIESIETARKTEAVDMTSLVEEMVSELRTGYLDRVIKASLTSTRAVFGDRRELRSAVSNLIINALKYSDHDEAVSVELYDLADSVVLEVKDRGVGIEAADLPRLTERFYRVDRSRSQRIGGTGLGLAIVKHVATSHEADLQIESKVGQGSKFSLVFPSLEQRR